MVDALNRLPNYIELVGILDQTCDVRLFTLQTEWLQSVYEYMGPTTISGATCASLDHCFIL